MGFSWWEGEERGDASTPSAFVGVSQEGTLGITKGWMQEALSSPCPGGTRVGNTRAQHPRKLPGMEFCASKGMKVMGNTSGLLKGRVQLFPQHREQIPFGKWRCTEVLSLTQTHQAQPRPNPSPSFPLQLCLLFPPPLLPHSHRMAPLQNPSCSQAAAPPSQLLKNTKGFSPCSFPLLNPPLSLLPEIPSQQTEKTALAATGEQ